MKLKIGDMVIASGYTRARRIKALDGRYCYVTGIGWGLKKDVRLVRASSKPAKTTNKRRSK